MYLKIILQGIERAFKGHADTEIKCEEKAHYLRIGNI